MANEIMYQSHSGNEIKLTVGGVRKFITKGNSNITDEEAVSFMMLCKHNQLDPFLNEAYLVKFKGSPAQMITSKEAFMKRAEHNPNFNGFKAGIIVENDGQMVKRDGALKMKNETILGAWCEVFRTDREVSTYVEIGFDEFSKSQATWKQQPANMIRKTAVVNGLREAFPNALGAMYTEDDKSPQDVIKQAEKAEEDETTNDLLMDFHTQHEPDAEIIVDDEQPTEVTEDEVENYEQDGFFEGTTLNPKSD